MTKGRKRWLASLATASLGAALLLPTAAVAQADLPALPAPEKTDVTIGLSVTEPSQFAVQLADMAGIFDELGMNAEVVVFEGDGRTLQALQAGQIDAGFIGVSAAINSQVTDAPVTILSTNATLLSDNIVSIPEITNADELRGQCAAVSTFGGTSHGAMLLGLEALGLTPEDVAITEVGGQSARIAALEGGSCGAAVVDVNLEAEMVESGFNVLVNLKEEGLPWGRSGLGVTEEFHAQNPNTALNILAATLQAQNMMWDDPEQAAAFYGEFAQFDEETASAIIADFQTVGNRSMIWEDRAFETPKAVLATVNPDIEGVDISTAYDRGPINTLIEMGYYDALGVEVPTDIEGVAGAGEMAEDDMAEDDMAEDSEDMDDDSEESAEG